ncbi:MAG TPA: hypothetical protein VFR41_09315 [Acidimicrobiia bacterium]|nr:hypothetical protein [Acidimicrobiia bacterium]
MTAILLALTALVAVVLSFLFAALVLTSVSAPRRANEHAPPSPESSNETISRVVADIERLAALRERGVLTDKEFAAQKMKVLRAAQTADG